jgi:hypothetical protein
MNEGNGSTFVSVSTRRLLLGTLAVDFRMMLQTFLDPF